MRLPHVRTIAAGCLLTCVPAGCGAAVHGDGRSPSPRVPSAAAAARRAAGARALAGLDGAALAGQRIVVGFEGTVVPDWVLQRARHGQIAGVIVYAANISSPASLAAQMERLQSAARPQGLGPLLTMIDQEGGRVARLPGAPMRSAAQMAREPVARVRSRGLATAAVLRRAGMLVDLAPVADLARPGGFETATERSFGRTAAAAGALSAAFASGVQAGGVAATLKHFPGIGGVAGDEDLSAQTVSLSRRQLQGADERAFAPGIAAGTKLVMLGTVRYPALDALPALLSPAVVNGELRQRLGFRGVALTDDLDVPALASFGTPAQLGVSATLAGADLLMFAHVRDDAQRGLDAVVAAVRDGRVPRATLAASAARVRALRASLASSAGRGRRR